MAMAAAVTMAKLAVSMAKWQHGNDMCNVWQKWLCMSEIL
jgi:hypothetical protein